MHRRLNLERARYPVVVLSASTGLVKRRKQPVALPTSPVAMVRTADARKRLRHGDRDFDLGSSSMLGWARRHGPLTLSLRTNPSAHSLLSFGPPADDAVAFDVERLGMRDGANVACCNSHKQSVANRPCDLTSPPTRGCGHASEDERFGCLFERRGLKIIPRRDFSLVE